MKYIHFLSVRSLRDCTQHTKMLSRHPLILKLCTVFATCLLVGILFYTPNANVFLEQDYYYVEQELERMYKVKNNMFQYDIKNVQFTIDQGACSRQHYLLIYIHSGPENAERRKVIRNTWASTEILKMHNAKLVFFMGQAKNVNLQVTLEYESELYHDIVQGSFTDIYRNLTYKAVTALKWTFKNCPNVVYVLKTDDDMIVDIHTVVMLMRTEMENNWGKKDILACFIWSHMNVDRNKNSKWYTSPAEFLSNFFPKYCSGSVYLMSSDVVEKFYLTSLDTPFFWIDDYYVTGMLAHASNISHKSLNGRYILENDADIRGQLANDKTAKLLFVHSPDTNTSMYVWQSFLNRRILQ